MSYRAAVRESPGSAHIWLAASYHPLKTANRGGCCSPEFTPPERSLTYTPRLTPHLHRLPRLQSGTHGGVTPSPSSPTPIGDPWWGARRARRPHTSDQPKTNRGPRFQGTSHNSLSLLRSPPQIPLSQRERVGVRENRRRIATRRTKATPYDSPPYGVILERSEESRVARRGRRGYTPTVIPDTQRGIATLTASIHP